MITPFQSINVHQHCTTGITWISNYLSFSCQFLYKSINLKYKVNYFTNIVHVSIVPKQSLSYWDTAFSLTSYEFSKSHFIFTAEKYVFMGNPHMFLYTSLSPKLRSVMLLTISYVLESLQTIALCKGSPDCLSNATTVSLWLVIPIALTFLLFKLRLFTKAFTHSITFAIISFGSCSNHPGLDDI